MEVEVARVEMAGRREALVKWAESSEPGDES